MNPQIENLPVLCICEIIWKARKNASDIFLWTQILASSLLKVLKIGLFIQRLKCDMCCVGIKPFDNFHLGLPFFLYFFSKLYTRNICSKQCQNMTYEHVYFRRMENGGGIRKERGLFCTTMYFLFSWELSAKKSIIAWMNEIWINLHNITTTPTLALKCQFTHNLKKPFWGDVFPTICSLTFAKKMLLEIGFQMGTYTIYVFRHHWTLGTSYSFKEHSH